MENLISIIMPNYNSAAYIRATIASVLNQTYPNWEFIIIDDCSTDASPAIIKEFAAKDKRIHFYRLKKNNGRPAVPRNIGLTHASGEYLAFIDSDDVWHSQKLELQLGIMLNSRALFSSTGLRTFKTDREIQLLQEQTYRQEKIIVTKISHSRLLLKNITPNSSVIVHKSLFTGLQFNEDIRYRAIEDYHCWLRMHQKINHSIKLNLKLLYYRYADTSISKSKFSMVKKNIMLYNEYKIGQKKLGLFRRIFYLGTYMILSVYQKLRGK